MPTPRPFCSQYPPSQNREINANLQKNTGRFIDKMGRGWAFRIIVVNIMVADIINLSAIDLLGI